MRRIIYILLIISLLIISASIFTKPVIIFFTKKQFNNVFIDSKVLIAGLSLKPLNELSLFGIRIKREGIYDIGLKEAGIHYTPLSILKKTISKLYLKDVSISINLAERNMSEFSRYLNLKSKGAFYLKNIEVLNLNVNLKSRDLNFSQEGGVLKSLNLSMDKKGGYLADVEVINFDLGLFVRDFNLGEKIGLSGKLNGRITLRGSGTDIEIIDGDFYTLEPGGMLVIKDNRLLENVARNSKQSLDILVESFKDYHYNTGIMKLSLEKGNLILDIALDGKAGKRNLNITVHDFKFRREGL